MIIVAYFILVVTLVQFIVALSNLIFNTRLPHSETGVRQTLVSVLIPARNEEHNIGNLLGDLLSQDHNKIEILVFNDDSSDNTARIVNDFIARDNRIKLFTSDHLPEGWLGKNRACHFLSKEASGEYLLFIDADVRVSNDIIIRSINYADRLRTGLISIFPKQIMKSAGELVTVPVMNYILLSLLPLVLVRRSRFSSLAAANGQFMFFNSQIYKSHNPHERFKSNKVEDIEIARYLKKQNITVACMTGDDTIRCRMYDGFRSALAGFSKNVSNFFGNSLLLATLFWLLTTTGFLFVAAGLGLFIFLVWLSAYLATRIIISYISEQNAGNNLILLVAQQVSLGLIILFALQNKLNRNYKWKDRDIKY